LQNVFSILDKGIVKSALSRRRTFPLSTRL